MLLTLLLAQAAAAQQPDIVLHATLEARSVRIERSGEASVRAWAEPDGGSTTRSSGTRTSRRFELKIDSRIANAVNSLPAQSPATDATEPR